MAVFVPDFAYKGGTLTDFLNPLAPILDGAWDVEAFVSDGAIYAYVSASIDHGIQLIDFTRIDNLPITPFVFAITDAEVGGIFGPREMELLTIGSSTFLITSSFKVEGNGAPGTISVFLMDQTPGNSFGDLTLVDSVTSDSALRGLTDFTVARFGFKTFVVGVSQSSNSISVISVDSDGSLGQVKTVTELGNPSLPLNDVVDVAYGYFNDQRYILSATRGLEGLGLWRLSANGTLTLVDTAKPNLDAATGINGFQTAGIHIAQVNKGVAVAFLYDALSHSVMSYTFANDEFTFRSSVSLGNAFSNDAMIEMKTLDYMGETFLVTSNGTNSTVSLFHMGGDGALALLQTVSHNEPGLLGNQGATYIQNTQGLDIVERDGRLWVVAASSTGGQSGGVTVVEIGAGATSNFFGGAENDKFFNFSSDLVAYGNGGDDLFRAGLGSMDAHGGSGNDDYRGSAKDETVYGGTGADTLAGGDGDDSLNGGAAPGDTLDGGTDTGDILSGGDGADSLHGGAGNDTLKGGNGNDVIRGTFGDDVILGGNGRDLIYAALGNDTIDGGTGADDFVFATNTGPSATVINNFEVALDQIKFTGPDLNDIFQVVGAMVQSGANVVITMPIGNTVTLTGILLDDLTGANFLFD